MNYSLGAFGSLLGFAKWAWLLLKGKRIGGGVFGFD